MWTALNDPALTRRTADKVNILASLQGKPVCVSIGDIQEQIELSYLFRLACSQIEGRVFNKSQQNVLRTNAEFALLEAQRHASIAASSPLVKQESSMEFFEPPQQRRGSCGDLDAGGHAVPSYVCRGAALPRPRLSVRSLTA
jgi:hypothetical protein